MNQYDFKFALWCVFWGGVFVGSAIVFFLYLVLS